MSRPLQQASNFQVFSVTLTDSSDGGTAVPTPSAAAFYLYNAATGAAIVSAGAVTPVVSGDDIILSYRASVANMTSVTKVRWQFKVTWTSPAREHWTPVELASVQGNLA